MTTQISAPPQMEFLDGRTSGKEGEYMATRFGRVRPTTGWATFFSNAYKICFDLTKSGTTANRPITNLYVGKFYFDTSLGANGGKPIWVASVSAGVATWVDATGGIV